MGACVRPSFQTTPRFDAHVTCSPDRPSRLGLVVSASLLIGLLAVLILAITSAIEVRQDAAEMGKWPPSAAQVPDS